VRKLIDIIESLNTVQPYTWDSTEASLHTKQIEWAVFYANGKKVQVDFFIGKDESAGVVFAVDGAEELTGEGDAFIIFATVIDIIKDFIYRHPEITQLDFDATEQEPSRIKLYRGLISRLLASGWKTSEREIENGQTRKFILRRN
jgi:hypothetical protein